MSLSKITVALRALHSDNRGVTAVEYGVIGALIIVICIAAITNVGTGVNNAFTSIATALGV